jgi:hypothetical protein
VDRPSRDFLYVPVESAPDAARAEHEHGESANCLSSFLRTGVGHEGRRRARRRWGARAVQRPFDDVWGSDTDTDAMDKEGNHVTSSDVIEEVERCRLLSSARAHQAQLKYPARLPATKLSISDHQTSPDPEIAEMTGPPAPDATGSSPP